MTCENCDPVLCRPGRVMKLTSDMRHCALCGKEVYSGEYKNYDGFTVDVKGRGLYNGEVIGTLEASRIKWDTYFYNICIAVSSKSPCLSRHIGAILVRDHSIVSTGFNGPSRGIPHCGYDRLTKDKSIRDLMPQGRDTMQWVESHCPRVILKYESGTHMELCPAQHAENNAIIDAARKGASTIGTTLYMNCIIPCKNCFGALINAGIVEIVVDNVTVYDKHTQYLIDNSTINIRRFEL